MRIVFFDTETGGITNDAPTIQIAAVAVDKGKEVGVFECKIQFTENDTDGEKEALEINHYRREDWTNAIPENIAIRNFANFCKQYADLERTSKKGGKYYVAMGAGHNVARFDLDRLMALAKKHDVFLPMSFQTLDTLQAAVWYFVKNSENPPENLKLGTLCKHFGIELTNAHEALADVRGSIALARKLVAIF